MGRNPAVDDARPAAGRRDPAGLYIAAVTATVLAALFFAVFNGDLRTGLLVALVGTSALLVVMAAMWYAVALQQRLLRDISSVLYDKALTLENETRRARAGDPDGQVGGLIPVEKPDIGFGDVAGLEDVKEEVRKAIVYPFEHPELYERYGKRAGEGILLYGPPGCGKTFIARATAGECRASFLTLKTSEIFSKWLGESEKNVQRAFDAAAVHAPAILFFDEVDAIGGKRGEISESHTKRLVNQLLVELDGLQGRPERLLTLAATNEPWAVDPALRRPGRFSKLIFVPPPTAEIRKRIFELKLSGRPVDPGVDTARLASLTEGYSSADIAQVVEEAADIPLKEALDGAASRRITMGDLEAVLSGRKSSLAPWFSLARAQIRRSGEEKVFQEMMDYLKNSTGDA